MYIDRIRTRSTSPINAFDEVIGTSADLEEVGATDSVEKTTDAAAGTICARADYGDDGDNGAAVDEAGLVGGAALRVDCRGDDGCAGGCCGCCDGYC